MYKKCEEILNKLESEGKIKRTNYIFPHKQELKLKLKDMLEEQVDEKYYLSDKMRQYIFNADGGNYKVNVNNLEINRDIACAKTTREGCTRGDTSDYVSDDGEYTNYLMVKNATKKGYLEAHEGDGVDISSRMEYHRGNVQQQSIQTLDCTGGEGHGVVTNDLRIRKLTPKECWRLMGFDDEDFNKVEKVNSNAQLYKQAGNSIVVNVLEAILKELLGDNNE